MQRNFRRAILAALAALAFAAAIATRCRAEAIAPQAQDAAKTSPTGAAARVATRLVTDEVGRRVAVPLDVKRVVSLAPNLTETIYALGLEDKLAGDTDYCDTPEAAKTKPHIGSPEDPDLEAILALHPDLVLAAPINRYETMDALARLGIAVYGTEPRTVEQMLASTARIAELLGAPEKGAALAAQLQGRLDALHQRLENRPMVHVLFVVWEDPLITIGQNTFIADALRWAGAESVITTDQDWPRIGMEEVVRVQPDWIVLAGDHMLTEETEAGNFRTRPAWKDLRAVELGRVAVASDDMTRPSPELVNAIEKLARALHPEAFVPATAGTNAAPEGAKAAATGGESHR